ncbi:MAG: hypothetical protein IT530_21180 [Burkholderiales bacterium]|nr:hypothetical protein [Burkholderiales bacterium]
MPRKTNQDRFADSKHQATAKVVAVVQALGEPDFEPKALLVIAKAVHLPRAVVWRILRALQESGWAKFIEPAEAWQLDASFTRFCFSFQRSIDMRRQELDDEVDRMTGRTLK